ncbi:MAG: hypothetical protein QHI48_07935 [Bacteroidota bacterium]|nr:hypothetical protein [Bacteroidota bacterium]
MTRFPPAFSLFPSFLLVLVLSGCSTEPETADIEHFHNPSWSPDGMLVAAGYERFASTDPRNGAPPGSPNFYILDLSARREPHAFHVEGFSHLDRFWILPDSPRVIAAITKDGLLFFDRDGKRKGLLTKPTLPVKPTCACFSNTGSSFLWAGNDNGRLKIGTASYTSEPWHPSSVMLLKDTSAETGVTDVLRTSDTTYAVRFDDGTVSEYRLDGTERARFSLVPLRDATPWLLRLHKFSDVSGHVSLYAVDDSGIVMLNPGSQTMTFLVKGVIRGFDINPLTSFMVFETRTGDTWLALRDGQPLLRLAPQHIMPSLSPDGKSYAAVACLTPYRDTLTVKSFSR